MVWFEIISFRLVGDNYAFEVRKANKVEAAKASDRVWDILFQEPKNPRKPLLRLSGDETIRELERSLAHKKPPACMWVFYDVDLADEVEEADKADKAAEAATKDRDATATAHRDRSPRPLSIS